MFFEAEDMEKITVDRFRLAVGTYLSEEQVLNVNALWNHYGARPHPSGDG